MSRKVSDEKLEVMHLQLMDVLKDRKKPLMFDLDGKGQINSHDISCIIDELKYRRDIRGSKGFKLGELSTKFIEMKIGETITIDAIPRSKLHWARKTARKKLANPVAVWKSYTNATGKFVITRMPDGTSPHARKENANVILLSSMRVGETVTIPTLTNGMKLRTRKVMNNPIANWSYIKLNNGKLRCQRTA